MGQLTDDILKWTLDINGQPARKELTEVSNATAKLQRDNKSLSTEMAKLEAHGKKGGEEWKKYEKQIAANSVTIKANEKHMEALRKQVGLTNLSATELRKEMGNLKRQMDRMDPNTAEWRNLNNQFTSMKGRLNDIGGGMNRVNGIMGQFKSLLPALGIGAVVGMLTNLGRKIISVRSEFEKYEAVLTNTLGSKALAKKELSMLSEFAATTPFALTELTGAFVKLTNYGLKPIRPEMVKMGDLASSVGKGFDQLTEAMADAVTGEFERLKEFGIKTKKEGDKVTFTFKEQATTVDFTTTAIKQYILSLGELNGVQGASAAIAETLGGRLSNLGDAWDRLLNKMGEGSTGVMVPALTGIQGRLEDYGKWFDIYASERVTKLNKFLSFFSDQLSDTIWNRLDRENKKAAADSAAAADIQNLFGVSTTNDPGAFGKKGKKGGNTAKTGSKPLTEEQKAKAAAEAKKRAEEAQKLQTAINLGGGESPLQTEDWMTTDTWDIQAERLAARKATEEEWTKFLTDQIEFRANAEAKAFEMEKEIAAARIELKDMQVEAIGQLASTMAGMFEQGSAAQIAMIAIEKAVAIAQIWINYAREMSAISLASANMAAQPWPGARAAALVYFTTMSAKAKVQAGINTGMVVAQAVASGVSSGKRDKKEQYYNGGYTGDGGTHEAAGTVHRKEYVTPSYVLQLPQAAPHIRALEQLRQNPSSPSAPGPSPSAAGGFDASTAQNLTTAIDKLMTWQPDIVITEIKKRLDRMESRNKQSKLN